MLFPLFITLLTYTALSTTDADPQPSLDQMVQLFQQNFHDMDKDSDGKVTLAEFSATFLKDDRNGDGTVTRDEYLQDETLDENRSVLAEEFSFYDKTGDGALNTADFQQAFNTIDTNHDGEMTMDEFVHYASHLFVNHLHPAFAVGK